MSDYEIRYERPRAGRMAGNQWIILSDGKKIIRTETEELAQRWIAQREAAVPARTEQVAESTAKTETPRRDRSADRVAQMVGISAPKSTGRCHYCGLPLDRHGHCDECI